MSNDKKKEGQSGGINVSGGSVSAGGDMVGGDKVTHGDSVTGDKISVGNVGSGAAVAAGRGANANVTNMGGGGMDWDAWRKQIEAKIDAAPNVSADIKQDAKDSVVKITTEAAKGAKADPTRLESLINTLAVMGPDIFEVVTATITNPLAGIGLVIKKIADKAKLERAAAK